MLDCLGIAIDRGDVGSGRKKGGAVSAAPKCTVENVFRVSKNFHHFVNENRRVVT
jgi:hypothetical protein